MDFKRINSHNLFKHVRGIEGKVQKPFSMIKDKSGNTHTNKDEVLKCLQEHFEAHLNTKFPHEPEEMQGPPPTGR